MIILHKKFIPFVLVTLLAACGGGGSDSSSSGGSNLPSSFLVSTTVNVGGSIVPSSLNVPSGQQGEFVISVDEGYQVDTVSGCGGVLSGMVFKTGSINSNCSVSVLFKPIPVNAGGTASNPKAVAFDTKNIISSTEPWNNYFFIDVNSGDRLILEVILDRELVQANRFSCALGSITFISFKDSVSTEVYRTCSKYITHVFENSGRYAIDFGYPANYGGYFLTSILRNGQEVFADSSLIGVGGRPDKPGKFKPNADNEIGKISMFNNYQYEGSAGDRLKFYFTLEDFIDNRTGSFCAVAVNRLDQSGFGVSVDFSGFDCKADRSEFVLPKDGKYNFNFRFQKLSIQTSPTPFNGKFRVEVVR